VGDTCPSTSYPESKQSWPEVIVHTRTDQAVELLQHYYALDGDKPCYTGSRFEAMAAAANIPTAALAITAAKDTDRRRRAVIFGAAICAATIGDVAGVRALRRRSGA
jgi:hypothetical protein